MDNDGSKSLSIEEFTIGIDESGLDLSEDEVNELFEIFDKDGQGSVEYEEFISSIRVRKLGTIFLCNILIFI